MSLSLSLSLSIVGGLHCIMPMFSEESDDNMAALLVSLQRSDVSVCVQKELACHAKFEAFKVSFVDNFDEHVSQHVQPRRSSCSLMRNFSRCRTLGFKKPATRRAPTSFSFHVVPIIFVHRPIRPVHATKMPNGCCRCERKWRACLLTSTT